MYGAVHLDAATSSFVATAKLDVDKIFMKTNSQNIPKYSFRVDWPGTARICSKKKATFVQMLEAKEVSLLQRF